MTGQRKSLDFLSTVQAIADSFTKARGEDEDSAVVMWREDGGEIVHCRGVPDDLCRALASAAGSCIADMVRRSGRPLRIETEDIPDESAELRIELRRHELRSIAVFPLFGEIGFLGTLTLPLKQAAARSEEPDQWWRLGCRWLEALQLGAVTSTLQAAVALDRREDAELADGVLVLDESSRIILVDGLFRELSGWAGVDVFGRSVAELPGGQAVLGLALKSVDDIEWVEHVLPLSPSQGVPVSLAMTPLAPYWDEGEAARVVFLRDLRVDGSVTRDGSERMLDLAVRAVHMADEMAHAVQVAESFAELDEVRAHRLGQCEHDLHFAQRVLGDVLDRCRGGEGSQAIELNELVEEVLRPCRTDLAFERVKLFTFPHPDLSVVAGDRLKLLRAIHILVDTARDSLRPGGGTLTARTWSDGGWVYVAVSDDGRGREDPMDSIAAPLFDSPEAVRLVGLDAVQELLEEMGGRLLTESRPRVWTRVTLMLRQERRTRPRGSDRSSSMVVVERDGERLSVLVIDDNAALRSVLRRCLERRGHAVVEASDGEHGLRILEEREFDRVVVDVRMPVKTGPEFYEGLRRVAPVMRARTIFMTGGFLESATERFIDESGRPSVQKPFDLGAMVRTIEA